MATNKVLDLGSIQRPTLDITLLDDERTVLRVTTPSERMIHELEQMQGEFSKLTTGDREAVAAIYDLMARLLSYNLDCVNVTAEELRVKYRVDLTALVVVAQAYLEFIEALNNEKN
jgi:hypothetical protein